MEYKLLLLLHSGMSRPTVVTIGLTRDCNTALMFPRMVPTSCSDE